MILENEVSVIEAILFLESEPADIKTLARIANLPEQGVSQALKELTDHYAESYHGIEIVRLGDAYQIVPKRGLWETLRPRYGKRNENRLSRAALETLSIIAYSQPITRGEIDAIRGVASDGMIRVLLARELIQEVGKKETPGRPIQFGTTRTFLRSFRLSSIADLPKLDDLEREKFELDGE
ncbi:MAG: SMC-Scp complex subunit ScpB [Spirochaetales bacterium]|nr:SMC-Scp complex subunit ScpB [Spirochaetales bacterium]